MSKIAIIRVRGLTGIRKEIRDTLRMLRLYKKNYCVVLDDTPTNLGMIQKIKDFVTYGTITDETYSLLLKKKAEDYKGRLFDRKGKIQYKKYRVVNGRKIKPYFRLNPPKKGFNGSIKQPFTKGGALGDRKDKINDLIKRML